MQRASPSSVYARTLKKALPTGAPTPAALNIIQKKADTESSTNHVLDYDIRFLTISSIGLNLTFLNYTDFSFPTTI